jgi:hypothetical protein
MKTLRGILSRFHVVGEVFSFLWKRKLWWLMPMIFILIALGLLMVFGQATGIGPFIYALF